MPDVLRLGDHEIWPGIPLYGRGGEQYEFAAPADDYYWYVHPMMEAQGWDGEVDYYASPHAIRMPKNALFPEPPKNVLIDEIAKAHEELNEVRAKIRDADREFHQFEHHEKERQERILRHEQLARLDDWIAGKITHLVQYSTSEMKLLPIAHYESDHRRGRTGRPPRRRRDRWGDRPGPGESNIKLLTLYGTTKGHLNWRFSHYRDGSGNSDYNVIPCASEAEARDQLQKMIDADIADWRADGAGAPTSALTRDEHAAKEYGLDFPDDAAECLYQMRIASHQRSVDNAREALAVAVKKLSSAQEAHDG